MTKSASRLKRWVLISGSLVLACGAGFAIFNLAVTRYVHLVTYGLKSEHVPFGGVPFQLVSRAIFRHTGNFCDLPDGTGRAGKNETLRWLTDMVSSPDIYRSDLWADFDEALKRCPVDSLPESLAATQLAGHTQLHLAIFSAPPEVIRRYLAAGARTDIRVDSPGRRGNGLDALQWAITLRDGGGTPASGTRLAEIVKLLEASR